MLVRMVRIARRLEPCNATARWFSTNAPRAFKIIFYRDYRRMEMVKQLNASHLNSPWHYANLVGLFLTLTRSFFLSRVPALLLYYALYSPLLYYGRILVYIYCFPSARLSR